MLEIYEGHSITNETNGSVGQPFIFEKNMLLFFNTALMHLFYRVQAFLHPVQKTCNLGVWVNFPQTKL